MSNPAQTLPVPSPPTSDPADLAIPADRPPDRNPASVYLAGLAPTSRRTLRGDLEAIARLLTGGRASAESLDWSRLRYQHVAAVRSRLADRYAPATANRMLAAVRGVMRECGRLELITAQDLARAVDVPPVRGRRLPRGRALSADEERRLYLVCQGDKTPAGRRDAAMLALGLAAGLRRSELVGVRFDDLDVEARTVRIRGKGNKERENPINTWAAELCAEWRKIIPKRSAETYSNEPVFRAVNKNGRIEPGGLTAQAAYAALARRGLAAGVRKFSPHDLRRTFATRLLEAGVDIAVVQSLMGHANIATTARYDHRGEAARRAAADLLGGFGRA